MDKKEIINKLADSGCLISPDLVYTLENEQAEKIVKFLNLLNQRIEKPLVLTNSFFIEVFQNEYKEISDERQVSTSLEIDSK
ncbi:MAG: hypothetical protein KJ767_02325, partial [Nanoarchaeota archaeon]|nr:hypothetical protein [Nanoarchaeota archaeon]